MRVRWIAPISGVLLAWVIAGPIAGAENGDAPVGDSDCCCGRGREPGDRGCS